MFNFKINKKTKKILIISVIVLVVIGLGFGSYQIFKAKPDTNYEKFAKCLSEKGFIMYGSKYCHFCQEQKKNFREGWKYVNYVECTKEQQKCTDLGISAIPLWMSKTGERYVGFQTFKTLSEISNCEFKEE